MFDENELENLPVVPSIYGHDNYPLKKFTIAVGEKKIRVNIVDGSFFAFIKSFTNFLSNF